MVSAPPHGHESYIAGRCEKQKWLTGQPHRSADHDIDDASNTQITIYSGRGLYIESTSGTIWLVGTAVEHHVLYNYQFANTKNIYASQLQTETPYFQPSPNSLVPFTANSSLNDPTFDCTGVSGNCDVSWGLRILTSTNVLIYGSNHYSFFDDYTQSMWLPLPLTLPSQSAIRCRVDADRHPTACSTFSAGEKCQARIVRLEGTLSNVNIYSLNTIGSVSMIDYSGKTVALYSANVNVYPSTIALFRSG